MDQVSEIKSRLDIVEVVSEYVNLKRAGTNFKGLCPFHQEKTPSFMVSPEKQLAYCFGCRQGGDVIAFVQQLEGLSFPETIRLLGERVGIVVENISPAKMDERSRLSLMHEEALKFYAKCLFDKKGEAALSYIKKRGLDEETIKHFKLGYAPDAWEATRDYLRKKGFKDAEIMAGGLGVVSTKGRGNYDRFRDRLMFPIFQTMGVVVAFGGRAMEKNDKAKYINSPETLIYDKSGVLYGLNYAKSSIKERDLVVVVEGYMDVIACHQFSFENVVASCGTALTSKQVKLLKRYTSNIAFAFDQDGAGQSAMLRGIDVALSEGMNVYIVLVPEGKDPDDCIRKDPALWQKAVEQKVPYMKWIFAKAFKKFDLSTADGKAKVSSFILPHLKKVPNLVEQSHYLQKLALQLGVSEDILRKEMKKIKGDRIVSRSSSKLKKKNSSYRKEHYVFGILMQHPSWIIDVEEMTSDLSELPEGLRLQIEDLRTFSNETSDYSVKDYLSHLSLDTRPSLELLSLYIDEKYLEMTSSELKEELFALIKGIKKEDQKKRLKKAINALRLAEEDKDETKVMELKMEIAELMRT